MKKLLNTIYVLSEEAYCTFHNDNIVIAVNEDKRYVPLIGIQNIMCFSYKGCSPALINACVEKGIGVALFMPSGRFIAQVAGRTQGNVLLRKEQYRISDDVERSCCIARNFIFGKIYNSKWCLERTIRDNSLRVDVEALSKASEYLTKAAKNAIECTDLDSLRGIEGEAASVYFGVFDHLILNQKESFSFKERSRRPPLDRINALLSFGYVVLAHDCASALEGVGLDSYIGFLHRDRPGRLSLALDLMEELRPVFVDRSILTLVNTKRITKKHFDIAENGAVSLNDEGRKVFISYWQERKQTEIMHPFLQEKLQWGMVPQIQAMLLSRYLRGDLDSYPPFLWK